MLTACAVTSTPAPGGEAQTILREAAESGDGDVVGIVRFVDGPYGLLVVPKLHDLEPGVHAAHVHEIPDCATDAAGTPAGAAGDHYDPAGTGVHNGPYGNGHLGDLPNLIVEADGTSRIPMLAPRLRAADLKGRALMIHAEADLYDAHSAHAHGKGGPRMFCGVIN